MARRVASVLLLVALAAVVALWLATGSPTEAKRDERSHARERASTVPAGSPGLASMERSSRSPRASAGALRVPPDVTHVAIGGGADPASTQVSLEQDIALLERVVAGPRVVLFASGGYGIDVQLEAASMAGSTEAELAHPASIVGRLGELFDPRPRDVGYRRAEIDVDGPADRDAVDRVLRAALTQESDRPLLIYVAMHGEPGDTPAASAVGLWGGDAFDAVDLAGHLDVSRRPVRFVVASCFSGGFAEAVFSEANAERGQLSANRCGFFSTSWDREASGCDPDPNRRAQQGYSLHFLNALAGRDRDGEALPTAELDLDGDGKVSMREAHARAMVASDTIDLPTTTSHWFLLRATEGTSERAISRTVPGPPAPEDALVIERLGELIGARDEAGAYALVARLEERLTALDERVAEAEELYDAAYRQLRIALLSAYPSIDDPYHPAYLELISRNHAALRELLNRSPEADRYYAMQGALDNVAAKVAELERRWALATRLTEAYRSVRLATLLERTDRAAFEQYEALLECERWSPPLR